MESTKEIGTHIFKDGVAQSRPMYLPCGGTAYFDEGSGISYRCENCGAVVGSVGQPQYCQDATKTWDAYEKSGMWRWNYHTGEPT